MEVFSVPNSDRMFTTTYLSDPRPRPHDFTTTPATKVWRFALMPPWASRHIGQYPRNTDARKGRPWVAQQHHNSTTRLRPLHETAARLSNTYMVAVVR